MFIGFPFRGQFETLTSGIVGVGDSKGERVRRIAALPPIGDLRLCGAPLTHGSRHAEFESPPVSAGLLRNADKA